MSKDIRADLNEIALRLGGDFRDEFGTKIDLSNEEHLAWLDNEFKSITGTPQETIAILARAQEKTTYLSRYEIEDAIEQSIERNPAAEYRVTRSGCFIIDGKQIGFVSDRKMVEKCFEEVYEE